MLKPDGPIPARIMLVGEAPGADEERQGIPFVGASGQELNRMLHEAGIMRSECFVTNVCRVRPENNYIGHFVALRKKDITAAHVPLHDKMVLPVVKQGYDMLLHEIETVKPLVIVVCGNLAMWALTRNWGITKWRGSLLRFGECYVIPTVHPAAVLRQWDWRKATVNDLRRAKRIMDGNAPPKPAWRFTLRPNFSQVMGILQTLHRILDGTYRLADKVAAEDSSAERLLAMDGSDLQKGVSNPNSFGGDIRQSSTMENGEQARNPRGEADSSHLWEGKLSESTSLEASHEQGKRAGQENDKQTKTLDASRKGEGGRSSISTPRSNPQVGSTSVWDSLENCARNFEKTQELWIDFDIETRAGHIACAGISWSRTNAMSVPFMCVENRDGYWNVEEEAHVVWWLYRVLTHPKVKVRWQNGLYDAQYTWRHWHFVPRGTQDTMISQHALFAALPKSLAFQASMYSEHYVYWKDEGKNWDRKMGEDTLWSYNCMDCVYTREVGEVEADVVNTLTYAKNDKGEVAWPACEAVHEFQQRLFWPVLKAMQKGLRVREKRANEFAGILLDAIAQREHFITTILGHPLNVSSPKQMHALFYTDLQQRPIWKRVLLEGVMVTKPTLDDDALKQIAEREPLLRPLCSAIADIRTLGKLLNDFVLAKRDRDGRMRCSFNIGGSASGESAPITFRLSSSQDAFGSGANLQTVPSDKSKSVGKFDARRKAGGAVEGSLITDFDMPNIREIFGPDPGYTWFDLDLDRADLQVVVWEAGDEQLKIALRMGVDIHLLNSFVILGKEPPPMEELVETHPKYWDHRGPMKLIREFAKIFCHATNYVGGAKKVAQHTGRTVHEIDRAQRIWFGAHPGIKAMHLRIEEQVRRYGFVENRFGYRWYVFDRLEQNLPEFVAWIPQSTVGCVINRAWMNIHENAPRIEVLLQVHDALAGQFPSHRKEESVKLLQENSRIVIPYEDPLIIPTSVKTSEVSWGDCE